jgi:hypothetical protein
MTSDRENRFFGLCRKLASLKLTVALLLLLAALVVGGTVYQAGSGIYAAQREVFASWFILLLGILPLPGMLTVSLLLLLNLLAALFCRLSLSWRRAGLLLVHGGLLLLIGGGFFIQATAREYSLTLSEGQSGRTLVAADRGAAAELPMTIKLLDFSRSMHPGTDIPKSFTSRVEIAAGGARRLAVISMNRPLRYRGYTFYQSSYAEDGRGGESSTFQVVRNSGRWLPYAASALIFLGLTLHFLVMAAAAVKRELPARGRP